VLEFLRRNRALLSSALFLVLAGALLVRTGGGRMRDDRLGRLFLEIMAPLQGGTAAVGRSVAGTWHAATDLFRVRRENETMRAHLRELEQQVARLDETDLENARLRKLLDFRETLRGDVLTARVIGRDATGLARTLVIDRGEADGLAKGAAVLTPEGIVGQVFLASRHAARILLINDHNSGVDALVQRTRARGIVEGTIDDGCGLKFVKRTEDVQVGDLVVTSGIDGIFPKGLPIGQIVAVDKRGQGLFQYAQIAPRVDFAQLEEVLVTRGRVEPAETDGAPGG
jgi:rod shape-determining protein MreC